MSEPNDYYVMWQEAMRRADAVEHRLAAYERRDHAMPTFLTEDDIRRFDQRVYTTINHLAMQHGVFAERDGFIIAVPLRLHASLLAQMPWGITMQVNHLADGSFEITPAELRWRGVLIRPSRDLVDDEIRIRQEVSA